MTSATPASEARLRAPRSRAGAVAVVLAVAVAGCGSSTPTALTHRHPTAPPRASSPLSPAPSPSPSRSPSWQLAAGQSLIAVAKRSVVTVVSATGRHRWRLHNPNSSGADLTFLVVGSRADAWKVRVPARPNGSVGWVAAGDVEAQVDDFALRASLRMRTLSVYRDGALVHRFRIGIGRPSAPTPTGDYFLTELLQAADPHGPYGPYAYGTSAFSDVYSEFEGGPGQIGVHGTNDPSSIGRNVSHGCLRLGLRDITTLAHEVPAGTPLTITD